MKKELMKRIVSCVLVCMMLVASYSGTALAEWDVKPSTVDYYVELNDASDVFIGNKETLGSKVGTEYYMTYTVESMEVEEHRQQGVIGTNVPKQQYPYVLNETGGGGLYKYDITNKMLVEGNTYFIKFTITEDGFDYRIGWAKDDVSKYIELGRTYGKVTTDLEYFGLWLGDKGMTGKLSKVRFYDSKGNDLGVITYSKNASVGREVPFPKDTKVEHTYTITLEDALNVAISNRRVPTGDKVYMEYTVKSSASKLYQTGAILSNAPKAGYPYLTGYMQFNTYSSDISKMTDGPLLQQGADYLIIFEKKADKFDITAQQTLNGKTTYHNFSLSFGTYNAEMKYWSLWFGVSGEGRINAVLENFKCYDSNKNNLGVQCNAAGSSIVHYGELEDYAGCEAVYCNEEDKSLYALYEDKTLKFTAKGQTKAGTYRIEEDVLTTQIDDAKKDYDYLYQYFTDEEGVTYHRLHSYKVNFETGTDTEIETQILNAENGYTVLCPTDPMLEGNVFEGWYDSQGEKFDFDSIVTESTTLYAKWAEVDYVDVSEVDYMPYVAIGISLLLIVAAITGSTVMIVRGKKHAGSR